MATDIAFMLGILALLGSRIPFSLKVFFTALAIADDLGAVLVIAIFYTDQIIWIYLLIAALILVALIILNRARIYSPLPYIIAPWSIAAGLIVTFVIGVIFGTYPAGKAAKLDPVVALHYE